MSYPEFFCPACEALVKRWDFNAPKDHYRCWNCLEATPFHDLPTRKIMTRGGGPPIPGPTPNTISVIDRGTEVAFDDVIPIDTLTKTAVTFSSGSMIYVCVFSHPDYGPVLTVYWNGTQIGSNVSHDVLKAGTGSRLTVFGYPNAVGGTGSLVVTMTTPQTGSAIMVSLAEAVGVKTVAPADSVGSSEGSGTSPSVALFGTTTQATDVLFGAFGTDNGAVGGSWGNSFTSLNDVDSTAFSGLEGMSVGYRLVTSTGVYTASKSGATPAAWTGVISSYKQA